ncbi:hypothetical protein ACFLRC_04315 [Candidatus Altiarchaeota archaeon]
MKNKGFIFTLDAVLATLLVLNLLWTSDQGILQAEKDFQEKLIQQRAGFDILNTLIEEGSIHEDSTEIRNRLNLLVPPNYNMTIHIYKHSMAGGTLTSHGITEVGSLPGDSSMIIEGERTFLTYLPNQGIEYYYYIEFWIYRQ